MSLVGRHSPILSTGDNRPMHSSSGSNHSSRCSEAKLLHVKFADLHISKEDSVKSWGYQLKCQLFEAEYLANEYSGLVPTDVSAIVHPTQQNAFRVNELRQLTWQSDGATNPIWGLPINELYTSGPCRTLIRYPSEANLSVIFRSKVE